MKKITDFLEQYVEWVALALGAAFLLFMAFQYVLSEPVSVQLAGHSFAPGEVDREIREQAMRLEERINPRGEPPVRIEVTQAVGDFEARLAMVNVEQRPFFPVFASEPLKLPPTTVNGDGPQPPDGPIDLQGAVATLASVPAAVVTESFAGRAYVNVPPAGVRPVIGAAPPAPGAALEGVQEDRQWVRVNYLIPIAQLNIAFRQAKLPLSASTLVHEVELLRQEQQPDGSWSPERPVKAIGTVALLKPPSGENPQEAAAFLQWAQANQQDILRPTFYQVLVGNDPIFGPPGENVPPVGIPPGGTPGGPGSAGFDAAAWLDTPPAQRVPPVSQLTDEQRRAIQAEQARRAKERRSQPQPQPGGERPPGGGRRGGGGFGENFGKPDPERPPFLQVRRPPPGVPPEYWEDPGMLGEPGMMPGQPQIPNAVPYDPLPQPPYNPAEVAVDLIGWAYDETPTPGRTYRYAIRYKIKNPLYGTFNMAAKPEDARILNLQSATSEWTKPVTIEPLMHFFIAQRFAPSAGNVKVKVFRWNQGSWRSSTFTAAYGDAVGGIENRVDYSTGWTLVDIRTEPGDSTKSYALFVDDRGTLVRRDTDADLADPLRAKLEAEANAAPSPAAPGEPAASVP
jgi:hypothetical protein